MNIEILHGQVGLHKQGDIVPVAAVAGGFPEADRLAGMGAAKFTTKAPTVHLPAAPDAVLEMTDDELLAENTRLRELLARADEDRQSALLDLRKAVAEAEAERDLHKEEHDRVAANRDALAKRVAELEAAAPKSAPKSPKGGKADAPPPAPVPPAPEPVPPGSEPK